MALGIFAAVLIAGIVYCGLMYNGLVALKHSTDKAWSNIDVLLKQRHDELPKLVEVCKQHMQFERSTLESVMAARAAQGSARAAGSISGVGVAEAAMRSGLGAIAATVEAYPELRSNDSIRSLLTRITALESEISDRREFYNEYVNTNNVRREQFPDVIIASLFGFKERALLRFSAAETSDVDIKGLFQA